MPRLLRTLALAGLEAIVVGLLLLTLTPAELPLGLLFAAVLLGWLADTLTLRLPPQFDRPLLAAGGLAAGLLLIGSRLGLGPLGALGALLPGSPQFGAAYGLLLTGLYLYWRGTRLAGADGAAIGTLFGRGAIALVLALLLRPIIRPGAETTPAALLGPVLAFVSLGLLAMALAHSEEEGVSGRRITWRWLLTLALAIGGVLLVGGLLATLLGGGTASSAAQSLVAAALLPFALLGAAVAWLIFTLFAGPLAAIGRLLRSIFDQLPEPPERPDGAADALAGQDPGAVITTLATSATWLMALIPLLILVVAILLLRRRRPDARPEEERESLGLGENLAGDLRDLLGRLRNPFARPLGGLRAALAALSGRDPASRVRRAYLRMLIELEARSPRPPSQTPAEYAAALNAAAGAPAPIDALTRAYEGARYNPAGVEPAAADAAEAALAAIAHRSSDE